MYISCNLNNYQLGENMAIVIDGIIGAGKTTVGKLLSEYYNIDFFEEIKTDDENQLIQRMLDRFYENPERWSAIIQTMFLNDRFRDIKAVERSGKPAIFDRSIYGDEVFARNIYKRGQMIEDEFMIYQNILKNMLEHIKAPQLLIFIDVSVDTAMYRINKRARSTEADLIPRDYMEDLYNEYQLWYEAYDLSPKIKIDFNKHMMMDDNVLSKKMKSHIISLIDEHIKKTL